MKKTLILLFIITILNNCTTNKVVKHHGVHYLEKKQTKLKISETNKNDAIVILGPPSTKNIFENDIWIYIERKTTVSELKTFGKKKLMLNNVLVLEFDNRGLLVKKEFYDKNQMNDLKVSENNTDVVGKDKDLIDTMLRNMKQKINDPLGKRKIK
tara:strand:- start:1106 stop:1570 length:465 start_codon:yes stop_codon:yes gene_type:complete